MLNFKAKKAPGRSWEDLTSRDFVTRPFLDQCAKILLDSILYEAKKESARESALGGEGIPKSQKFYNSFYTKVDWNRRTVEVWSTWPTIDQIIEGRRPYEMKWLTQENGVKRVPTKVSPGNVVIKTTPGRNNPWVHPGFKKHDFIDKGYKRAQEEIRKLMMKRVLEELKKTPVI